MSSTATCGLEITSTAGAEKVDLWPETGQFWPTFEKLAALVERNRAPVRCGLDEPAGGSGGRA